MSKTKIKKRTLVVLCIALALCLISMIGTSCMQGNWGGNEVTTYRVTLSELADMIRSNNEETGRTVDLTFTEDTGYQLSFILLRPKTATKENPAPVVVCAPGRTNTKELYMGAYVELARRGFVVISMDLAGHGKTDAAMSTLTAASGMDAAVEFAMSLPYVDTSKVGMTGHSHGNLSCFNTIQAFQGTNNHVAAWLQGAGTKWAGDMTNDSIQNLLYGVDVNAYDEFDGVFFDGYYFMTSDLAKYCLGLYYPEFEGAEVPEGQWFTADGNIGENKAEGTALGEDQAVVFYHPEITHPMFVFSNTGVGLTVKFFYDAFGTPAGAKYLPSTNQVWGFTVFFEVLGLIGYFMLLFPIVDLLLCLPVFDAIRRKEWQKLSGNSLRDRREWIPLVVTLLILSVYSFYAIKTFFPYGESGVFGEHGAFSFDRYPSMNVNALAFWSFCGGLFTLLMIFVNQWMRRLAYRKSGLAISEPFEGTGVDNFTQLAKTVSFALLVVALMNIPVVVAYYAFQADFRICYLAVMSPRLRQLPMILIKYLPFWVIFYIPSTILNLNTRFKDVPDWLSTLICAVGNTLSLAVFMIVQYHSLFTTGRVWAENANSAAIICFTVIPCLFYAAYSTRYIFKRTNNVWAAGLTNAMIMCLMSAASTEYIVDAIFF